MALKSPFIGLVLILMVFSFPNLSHLVKGVGWGSYLCSYTLNFWPGMLLERNVIQNAENIFSSHQQTAKGTSVSGPAGQQLLLSRCELSIALICQSSPSAQLKTCIKMISNLMNREGWWSFTGNEQWTPQCSAGARGCLIEPAFWHNF